MTADRRFRCFVASRAAALVLLFVAAASVSAFTCAMQPMAPQADDAHHLFCAVPLQQGPDPDARSPSAATAAQSLPANLGNATQTAQALPAVFAHVPHPARPLFVTLRRFQI